MELLLIKIIQLDLLGGASGGLRTSVCVADEGNQTLVKVRRGQRLAVQSHPRSPLVSRDQVVGGLANRVHERITISGRASGRVRSSTCRNDRPVKTSVGSTALGSGRRRA